VALGRQFAESPAAAELQVVRVRADARILETRIKDWLALVEGALA